MKRNSLLALLFLFLSSCSPSEQSIQTATPMNYELLRPQIESVLFLEHDLPENWEPGLLSSNLPANIKLPPDLSPAVAITQVIHNISYDESGFILVMIYAKRDDAAATLEAIAPTPSVTRSIGERSKSWEDGRQNKWQNILLLRCNAVIFVNSYGPLIENLLDYARRVDARLTPFVCL